MCAARIIRSKNRKDTRLKADASKLNLGNTYSIPPEYYYDSEFECIDCGKHQIWTAKQQQWWYEEAGGYFLSSASRCRVCRENERARKKQARIDAGHKNS